MQARQYWLGGCDYDAAHLIHGIVSEFLLAVFLQISLRKNVVILETRSGQAWWMLGRLKSLNDSFCPHLKSGISITRSTTNLN